MKKLLIIFFAIAVLSCREEFGDIGQPFDRASGISGTWTLTSVVQNDENAISKDFPKFVQSVDITNRAKFNTYQLILSQDESGNPSTFQEVATDAPSIIGIESGIWSLDDIDTPGVVTFTDNGSTYEIEIATYLGLSEGILTLKKTRYLNEKPVLSYVYTFQKD